jgi:ABC-type proline/glycine betaine transport system permease subunit
MPSQPEQRQRQSMLGSYGERPPSPFGGLPVSEVAIFVGAVGACVGFFGGGKPALIVGVVVCALGVLEFTVREHFSGFRSHAMLLAAMPPVAILAAAVALLGAPRQRTIREILVVAILPIFGVGFWALRKRFRTARQSRIVRPPAA